MADNIRAMREGEKSKMDAVMDYMQELLGDDTVFVVLAMAQDGGVDFATNSQCPAVSKLLREAANVFDNLPEVLPNAE